MEIFVKPNNSSYHDQLICEAQGLEELAKLAQGFRVPKVERVNERELVMEKIAARPFTPKAFHALGYALAKIHQKSAPAFGLDADNYIGLNPQKNVLSANWGEFYHQNRLCFQVGLIQDKALKEKYGRILRGKKKVLIDFLNAHRPLPSPLHGDLWSGNILYDGQDVWLIDPAFYWGDREADIAMTRLFGGFAAEFYQAYDNEYALAPGYKDRQVIYQLYHYLNHYNLFGASYLSSVESGFEFINSI